MSELRAIEFLAFAPTDKQPYKPHGDGGCTALLDVGEQFAAKVEQFWKASRGKNLRVLVEVQD